MVLLATVKIKINNIFSEIFTKSDKLQQTTWHCTAGNLAIIPGVQ